jgi:GC-rich sequence DNA-binding factor
MASFTEEHARAEAREIELREMITRAEEKRSWFAAFREWIESVATFLDEKVSG